MQFLPSLKALGFIAHGFMNFYEYMFGMNKKEETAVAEKAVSDEVAEKTVKDALVEELEETEKTPEGDEKVKKEETVSKDCKS